MKTDTKRIRPESWRVTGVELGRRHPDGRPGQRQCDAVRKVEPAINHMRQHVNEFLRVSTLSALVGVSASNFHLIFKSATGSTPMDFFIRLRIQRACELLRARDLSVKEAAHLLGYNDPCYFSRIFKSVIGVAPRHYQNRILNSPPEQLSCPMALQQRLNWQTRF